MNDLLVNKKVLYVAPVFFGYENEIKGELERQGAEVTFLLDRPFKTAFLKALTRVRREWVIGAADRYYKKELASTDAVFDYVFVVNGQTLSKETLKGWRQQFPSAKFILYMWDSFSNRKQTLENLEYFDSVFSFDKDDAQEFGVHFRPLFFSKGFEATEKVVSEFDISFIGTAHTDRFSIVRKIDRQLGASVKKYWYLFLQANWVYWFYRLTNTSFRNASLKDFKFDSISKAEVQRVFNLSKVILDIEHPYQTGLTMRTLETLGACKKLVTTNSSVKLYDFYKEANIHVIDRSAPNIPLDFFDKPYERVEPQVYRKYSLEGWVEEIVNLVNLK